MSSRASQERDELACQRPARCPTRHGNDRGAERPDVVWKGDEVRFAARGAIPGLERDPGVQFRPGSPRLHSLLTGPHRGGKPIAQPWNSVLELLHLLELHVQDLNVRLCQVSEGEQVTGVAPAHKEPNSSLVELLDIVGIQRLGMGFSQTGEHRREAAIDQISTLIEPALTWKIFAESFYHSVPGHVYNYHQTENMPLCLCRHGEGIQKHEASELMTIKLERGNQWSTFDLDQLA